MRDPVPVQNSFLKRISAISAQSDRLESWRCLSFLKKTAAFHSVRQISLIALPLLRFPDEGSYQIPVQTEIINQENWAPSGLGERLPYAIKDRPLFPPPPLWGNVISRKFFPPSIEHLQIFSSTGCADNFFG